jgi:hypothetical protein
MKVLSPCCTNFATEQSAAPLTFRIQQVLGSPPTEVVRSQFAEYWVRSADLIRLAPDPGISDHQAELDFPVSQEIVTINDAYKAWFLEHKAPSTTSPYPGPGRVWVTPMTGETSSATWGKVNLS